jgi:hypothetical protein
VGRRDIGTATDAIMTFTTTTTTTKETTATK